MIRFVLMDLDDTVFDFGKAESVAIRKTLFSCLGREVEEKTVQLYRTINAAEWKRLERGEVTREVLKLVRFEKLFSALGVHVLPQKAQALYEQNLADADFFVEGALELLQELSGRYLLYAVSNGNLSVQKNRIARAQIADYFRDIFISEEVGAVKPQVEFFDYCFSKIPNFRREEAIILGDSLTSDVQGGINAGIHTCHFLRHPDEVSDKIVPDFQINKLSQFYEILNRLNQKCAKKP